MQTNSAKTNFHFIHWTAEFWESLVPYSVRCEQPAFASMIGFFFIEVNQYWLQLLRELIWDEILLRPFPSWLAVISSPVIWGTVYTRKVKAINSDLRVVWFTPLNCSKTILQRCFFPLLTVLLVCSSAVKLGLFHVNQWINWPNTYLGPRNHILFQNALKVEVLFKKHHAFEFLCSWGINI